MDCELVIGNPGNTNPEFADTILSGAGLKILLNRLVAERIGVKF